MSTNIIDPTQIPVQCQPTIILNQFGVDIFSGVQIVSPNDIAAMKSEGVLGIIVINEDGSIYE